MDLEAIISQKPLKEEVPHCYVFSKTIRLLRMICVYVAFYTWCPGSSPWTAIKIFSHLYKNRGSVDYILEAALSWDCQISETDVWHLLYSKGAEITLLKWG